jgi:Primase X
MMTSIQEERIEHNQCNQVYTSNHSSTTITEGLDFILSHFEQPLWPRTIFTHTLGRQLLVYNTQEALARFKQANFIDCRINAYPYYNEYQGINRQVPNFIFIDLDRSSFKSDRAFRLATNKTRKNIQDILCGNPTILWTGNGIHVYQPIAGLVLESESLFSGFDHPSQAFLKFAALHLSNHKCDMSNNPAFRSCLVRIPWSHNFKCVQGNNGIADSNTEVKIIQKWDGNRPRINSLLYRFYICLAGEKIKEINQLQKVSRKKSKMYNKSSGSSSDIEWIEKLIQTPIPDHRKFASHWILSRYLINVKHMTTNDAYAILKDWSIICNGVEALLPSARDFDMRLRYNIKEAVKNGKAPIGKNLLRAMNKQLYSMLFFC